MNTIFVIMCKAYPPLHGPLDNPPTPYLAKEHGFFTDLKKAQAHVEALNQKRYGGWQEYIAEQFKRHEAETAYAVKVNEKKQILIDHGYEEDLIVLEEFVPPSVQDYDYWFGQFVYSVDRIDSMEEG